jgi:hypothetical protein
MRRDGQCHEATKARTQISKSAKLSTSRKVTKIAASGNERPSVVRGRRSMPRHTVERNRAPDVDAQRITNLRARADTSVDRARVTPSEAAPRRRDGRRDGTGNNGGTVERTLAVARLNGGTLTAQQRRSTVPPFHRSTVPPFHRSTVPPFHRRVPPFNQPAAPRSDQRARRASPESSSPRSRPQ